MNDSAKGIVVRNTAPQDFPEIIAMSRLIYPSGPPWTIAQLTSHLGLFPDGQFVAVESETKQVVGMSASLIVFWDNYDMQTSWVDFTDRGMFTNHNPAQGRTLYGAEVMVHPAWQRRGIGTRLYHARRELVQRLGLLRIRAGARLRDYHRHADRLTPTEYVRKVSSGELQDATLSFQLKNDFRVLAVVPHYLKHDPESLGHVAVIEWINPLVAASGDYASQQNATAGQQDPPDLAHPRRT